MSAPTYTAAPVPAPGALSGSAGSGSVSGSMSSSMGSPGMPPPQRTSNLPISQQQHDQQATYQQQQQQHYYHHHQQQQQQQQQHSVGSVNGAAMPQSNQSTVPPALGSPADASVSGYNTANNNNNHLQQQQQYYSGFAPPSSSPAIPVSAHGHSGGHSGGGGISGVTLNASAPGVFGSGALGHSHALVPPSPVFDEATPVDMTHEEHRAYLEDARKTAAAAAAQHYQQQLQQQQQQQAQAQQQRALQQQQQQQQGQSLPQQQQRMGGFSPVPLSGLPPLAPGPASAAANQAAHAAAAAAAAAVAAGSSPSSTSNNYSNNGVNGASGGVACSPGTASPSFTGNPIGAALVQCASPSLPAAARSVLKDVQALVAGYALGPVLGIGTYGEVRAGISIKTGEQVAVKLVDLSRFRSETAALMLREITILQRLDHKHCIKVVDVLHDVPVEGTFCSKCACTCYKPPLTGGITSAGSAAAAQAAATGAPAPAICLHCSHEVASHHATPVTRPLLVIIQEIAAGGELFAMLMQCGALPEPVARVYFTQLLDAIEHCHARGVVHRDIKPENLVFDSNFSLKVVDFGLAACVADRPAGSIERELAVLHSGVGSKPYSAPEVSYTREMYNASGYKGYPADLWSCAVVLFVMLAGRPPFYKPLLKTFNPNMVKCKHFARILKGQVRSKQNTLSFGKLLSV